jgi:hypothetical protein
MSNFFVYFPQKTADPVSGSAGLFLLLFIDLPEQQPQKTFSHLFGTLAFRTETGSEDSIHCIIEILQLLFRKPCLAIYIFLIV